LISCYLRNNQTTCNMKRFSRTLAGLAIFVLLFLAIAALLPSGYTLTRETTINSTRESIFPLFGDLRQWEKWSAWKQADPEAQFTYSENSTGAGAKMSWEGKKIGTGELQITQYKENEMIRYAIRMKKPWKATSEGSITIEKSGNGEKVVWIDRGKFGWPIARWMGLFVNMEKMQGPDFEKNLAQIKTLAEAMPVVKLPEIEVEVREVESVTIAGIRFTCPIEDIGTRIGESYGRIMEYLERNKVKAKDVPPLCIYHKYSDTETDMEPALVVPADTKAEGDIAVHPSYGGQTMVVKYYGDYAAMAPTYAAMEKWMSDNGKQKNGSPWESYITDPEMEKDTAKWLTEIYWPVK